MESRFYSVILLSLVVLVSACAQNNTAEEDISNKISIHSISYIPTETVSTRNSNINASLNLEFKAQEEDNEYTLTPGLYLKVFNQEGELLEEGTLAEEKKYTFNFREDKIDRINGIEIFNCFSTKKFAQINSWNLSNRGTDNVYCEKQKVDPPKIDFRITPSSPTLHYDEINWESMSPHITREINITNTGEVKIKISPAFRNTKYKDRTANGVAHFDNGGSLYLGRTGKDVHEKELVPNQTKTFTATYYPSTEQFKNQGSQDSFKQISATAHLLINAKDLGNISSGLKSKRLTIRVE